MGLWFAAAALAAQRPLRVTVLGADVATSCNDIFSGPDLLYQVSVAGQALLTYDPAGADACYQMAPNVQFQGAVAGACSPVSTVEICFNVLENDALLIPCAVFPSCFERLCRNFTLPAPGRTRLDTLSLPAGGSSAGALYFQLALDEDPSDFNYRCGAVDLGVLAFGQTLGDAAAGLYSNVCADSTNEINPVTQGNSLFNTNGVWFRYRTGPQVSPVQVIRVFNDPEATGDSIDLELLVYTSDSCNGLLQRFPSFRVDYSGRNAQINLFCALPNQDYYVLVDGEGLGELATGRFSILAFDPGLLSGGDRRCDATDLGEVAAGATVSHPNPLGNFCAGFADDPFVPASSLGIPFGLLFVHHLQATSGSRR
ncbi:MAG: hypothetical protein HC821_03025 [Lewinella sp.]|nr:hypothetical protein [Lewinella sp.]